MEDAAKKALESADPKAALLELAEKDPKAIIHYMEIIGGLSYEAEIVEKAMRKAIDTDPGLVVYNNQLLEGWPDKDEIIDKALWDAADKAPDAVFYREELYADWSDEDKAEINVKVARGAAKVNPELFFTYPSLYESLPDKDELIKQAVKSAVEISPGIVIRQIDNNPDLFKDWPNLDDLKRRTVDSTVVKDPFLLIMNPDLLKGRADKDEIVENSYRNLLKTDPNLIYSVPDLLEGKSYQEEIIRAVAKKCVEDRPAENLRCAEVVRYHLPEEEAEKILATSAANATESGKVLLYPEIYRKLPNAAEIVEKAFETPSAAKRLVRQVNDLHDETDSKRFAVVDGLSAEHLYQTIAEGRQELYTSTHNGLLERFHSQLKAEGKTLIDIAMEDNKSWSNLPIFIEAAAAYNKLDDVLERVPANKYEAIASAMIGKVQDSDDFNYTVALADTVAELRSKEFSPILSQEIRNAYENAGDSDEKVKFGLVASTWATENLESIPEEDRAFYLGIKNHEDYKLPDTGVVKSESLRDETGDHYQLYTFYDDPDGKASYNSFTSYYKADKQNWEIQDKGNYIYIHSKNGEVDVHIYANKPQNNYEAQADIDQAVQNMQGSDAPQFDLVAHRGHSYHVEGTIEQIKDSAELVFLGSCGGYHEISRVAELSPDAHILATKETGTMFVNDPLFYAINNRIRQGQDIDWKQVWEEDMSKITDIRKESYIRPDQNRAALLNKKYNEISDKEASIQEVEKTSEHASAGKDSAQDAAKALRDNMQGELAAVESNGPPVGGGGGEISRA